jgi:hypothetical protein
MKSDGSDADEVMLVFFWVCVVPCLTVAALFWLLGGGE